MQDKKGYLWFCSDAGVTKYNGHTFCNYSMADGLTDNEVLRAVEDSKGRIWFFTFNNKLCYFYENKIFNLNNDSLLAKIDFTSRLTDLYEDHEKNIWLITETGEMGKLTGTNFYRSNDPYLRQGGIYRRFHPYGKNSLLLIYGSVLKIQENLTVTKFMAGDFYHLTAYFRDGDAGFYISKKGISRMVDTTSVLIYETGSEYNKDRITMLYYHNKNELWFNELGDGCYRVGATAKRAEHFFPGIKVSFVCTDHEGNTWVSTLDNGIYQVPAQLDKIKVISKADGLAEEKCYAVYHDIFKNTWIGHSEGEVTRIKNGKCEIFNFYRSSQIIPKVTGITGDSKGTVYIASDQGISFVPPGSKVVLKQFEYSPEQKNFAVKSVQISDDENLCVAYYNGLFLVGKNSFITNRFEPKLRIKNKRHFVAFEDHEGITWASNVDGFGYYDNTSFILFPLNEKLASLRVNDIREAGGVLAIATNNDGIYFIRNKKTTWHVTKENGLSDNFIRKMIVHNSVTWAVTSSALFRIDISSGEPQVSNFTLGLENIAEDINDVFVDSDFVYLATGNGLLMIPGYYKSKQSHPPFVYPLEVTVDTVVWDINKNPEIPFRHRRISLSYDAISFQATERMGYQYRVGNNNWNNLSTRIIEFSSLSPGNYDVYVRAKKINSDWSIPVKFSFIVPAPYWQKIWFRLLIAFLIILSGYLFLKHRIRKIKKQEEEKTQINKKFAELKLEALRAQMNPHFIFNCLNAIQHYNIHHDYDSAQKFLGDFAALIRKTLELSKLNFVPLADEIDFITRYLDLEKLRFEEKFDYQIIIGGNVDPLKINIPSFLLQPYVENSVNHGIKYLKDQKGKLIVSFALKENTLVCTIDDNGIGIRKSKELKDTKDTQQKPRGIELTNDRVNVLNRIHNTEITIRITDKYDFNNKESGTIVELVILPDAFIKT